MIWPVVFLLLMFTLFVAIPICCYYVRLRSETLAKFCPQLHARQQAQRRRRLNRHIAEVTEEWRLRMQLERMMADRQGNVFTINTDSSGRERENFPHLYSFEPNSDDLARIRAQLEKDEKDLPTYEQVLAMSAMNLTAPTASASASSTVLAGNSATSYSPADGSAVRVLDEALPPLPPSYTEIDEHAPTAASGSAAPEPTTSRAAAASAAAATQIRMDENSSSGSPASNEPNASSAAVANAQLSNVTNASSSVV